MSDNLKNGWFAVKRGITSHPVFERRPDRLMVWIWMIETAAWKGTRQSANGRPVEVKRGQLLTSYRQISAATGVGKQVVETLIKLLRDESAIRTDIKTGRLLITISNYDKYQSQEYAGKTEGKTEPRQSQDTKETKEQINNIPTSSDAAAPVDPVKAMFDGGVRVLGAGGVNEKNARSMIGRWRKQHGDEAVMVAIGNAQRQGAVDPIAFIEGHFRQRNKKSSHPEIGEIRIMGGKRKQYAGNGAGWMVLYDD